MDVPAYYLGIDGGATKTEAVIADGDGNILATGQADGSNLHNFPIDISMEHMRLATDIALAHLCKDNQLTRQPTFKATCIGLAGLDTSMDFQKINKYFSDIPSINWPMQTTDLFITNDGLVGLKSGTDQNYGICLISSTGSNCYGINQAGKYVSAGDWGHLLGDQGSSYAIGLKLLRIIVKEYDGRRSQSILTEKVLNHLKINSIPELVSDMYRGQPPVKTIASLTHLYADPDLAQNEDLLRLIRSCGQELILAYQSIVRQLELTDVTFPVVLIGGLFNLTKQLTDIVTSRIKEITPQAEVVIPNQIPAAGATKIAIHETANSTYPNSTLIHLAA